MNSITKDELLALVRSSRAIIVDMYNLCIPTVRQEDADHIEIVLDGYNTESHLIERYHTVIVLKQVAYVLVDVNSNEVVVAIPDGHFQRVVRLQFLRVVSMQPMEGPIV